jgi:MFS family permease
VFAATRAWAALGRLSPPVWRVLLHSLILGLAMSVADLLFNFYLVSLGYAADTAGMLSTISRAAGIVLALPIGMLIDRAGPRRALLIGMLVYSGAWLLPLLSAALWVLAVAQFFAGAAYILAAAAVTPLLASVTPRGQQAAIFGINASAAVIVGIVGSSVGGTLPWFAGQLLDVAATSAAAYRLALATVCVLALAALLPVLKVTPGAATGGEAAAEAEAPAVSPLGLVRYALASVLLGMGSGAVLPFQNLFFRQQFGLSDAAVGVVLAWAALGMGLGGLIGAPVSARLGLKRAAWLLRLGATPSSLLMLAPLLPVAAAAFFMRGLFVVASYPLNDALVMQALPARQRGMAASLMSTLWALGWAVTAALSGWAQIRWGFAPSLIGAALAYALSSLAIAVLPMKYDTL